MLRSAQTLKKFAIYCAFFAFSLLLSGCIWLPMPTGKGFTYSEFNRLKKIRASKEAVYESQRFPSEIRKDGSVWIYKFRWPTSAMIDTYAVAVYSTAAAVITFNHEDRVQNVEFIRGDSDGAVGCTPSKVCVDDMGGVREHSFPLRAPDEDRTWPLVTATENGDLVKMKHFIEMGEDVNASDISGSTSLHYAVMAKNTAAVKLLLENNANPNIKHKNTGETALHWAVRSGNIEIVKLLSPRMEDINAIDNLGISAADIATLLEKSEEISEVLIRNGATK